MQGLHKNRYKRLNYSTSLRIYLEQPIED